MTAPIRTCADLMALGRKPSKIEPGPWDGRPFSYVEVVQPLLDKHCVRCHGGEKTEADLDLTGTPHQGFTRSYWSLCGSPDAWKVRAFDPAAALVPAAVFDPVLADHRLDDAGAHSRGYGCPRDRLQPRGLVPAPAAR